MSSAVTPEAAMSRDAPLICLHGFGRRPSSFDSTLASMGRGECEVVVPELAGHGAPLGDWDEEVARLAALAPRPAIWVGYSLGGRLVLGVVARYPEKVRAAVLIGAHPGLRNAATRWARQRWDDDWATRIEAGDAEAFADAWARLPIFEATPPAVAEAQRRERLIQRPRELAAAMRRLGLGRMPSLWSVVQERGARLRWVAGSRDAKFCALAREAASHGGGLGLDLVPEAGHDVLLEAPEVLAGILAEVREHVERP